MCGRYTLRSPGKAVRNLLQRDVANLGEPRFNIAPGERLPVVFQEGASRLLKEALWGLVPPWTGPGEKAAPIVNARSETVQSKPAFREPFSKRRCLVPADGFYEWKTVNGQKRPYFIRFNDDRPFAFAALWEEWKTSDGTTLPSFCLITTEPNDVMKPIHDRMPVILDADRATLWLTVDEEAASRALPPLLWPFSAEEMTASPVDTWVNKAGNEGPRCLEPWKGEDSEQLSLF